MFARILRIPSLISDPCFFTVSNKKYNVQTHILRKKKREKGIWKNKSKIKLAQSKSLVIFPRLIRMFVEIEHDLVNSLGSLDV